MDLQKKREHLLDALHSRTAGVWSSATWWWRCLVSVSLLAVVTRLISLHQPPGTTWDEVHFGGFANQYINRTFFHDVHPPLGKMLVAGALYLTGYKATFPFSIGTLYPADIDYVFVRGLFGVLGSTLVPLSFLTVWQLTKSLPAALLSSLAILTDHYTHRLTTLILLDCPLLVAIMASVYSSFAFHNTSSRPWSWQWWLQLSSTGVWLAVVMSIKYIGVFTVVFVGLHTAFQLYTVITDPDKPMWHVLPHTAARALCLIVLPCLLYLASFVLHFAILSQWVPSAGGFYHSRFVSSFNNTEYDGKFFPKYLDYGANITLRNSMAMSGYLESWYDLFPSDATAPCQQVTLTTLKDEESLTWTIRFVNVTAGQVEDANIKSPGGGRRVVRTGDHVVLTHTVTGRSLRAHGHRAPVTKRHFQACGYGDDFEAGPFETWQIVVPGAPEGVPLHALGADFQLRNWQMKCYLANPGNVQLPSWAYNSAKEVTCTKNAMSSGLLWHVHWLNQTRMPLTRTASDYSMSLWEKIVYQHEAMILGNSGLKPSAEDLSNSARPWMWPLMYRLQTLSVYNKDDIEEFRNKTARSSNAPEAANLSSSATAEEGEEGEGEEQRREEEEQRKEEELSEHSLLMTTSSDHGRMDASEAVSSSSRRGDVDQGSPNSTEPYPIDDGIDSHPAKVSKRPRKKRADDIFALFMNNPVVAYLNLLSFVLLLALVLYHLFMIYRKTEEQPGFYARRSRTVAASFWVVTCWAIHYMPFFAMTRILYTHHYLPAYLCSSMLSGIMIAHLCESASYWWQPRRPDLLLTVLTLLTASGLLVSYYLLFPLATFIEGRISYRQPSFDAFLDKLNLGQPWMELGYQSEALSQSLVTMMDRLEERNMKNPDVNATLYYVTKLDPSPQDNPSIVPVAASNFSMWRTASPQAGEHRGTISGGGGSPGGEAAVQAVEYHSTAPTSSDGHSEEGNPEQVAAATAAVQESVSSRGQLTAGGGTEDSVHRVTRNHQEL